MSTGENNSDESDSVASLATRPQQGNTLVILAGLATSALALLIAWLLNQTEFNVMGWYFWFIVPVGAVLVGLVAGSGYSLASWQLGVKVTGLLLWSIIALQIACYFQAQYLEFRHLDPVWQDGTPIGFFEFFDYTTRTFAFEQKGGKQDQPMGVWGYAFRLLEVAGFALGGLIGTLILGSKPYCENCGRYMKTRSLALLPAGAVPRKIKKKDTEAQQEYEAELNAKAAEAEKLLEEAVGYVRDGDSNAFRTLIDPHVANRKEIGKLTTRLELELSHCPGCSEGHLKAKALSGQGEQLTTQELQTIEATADFVTGILRQ